MPANERQAEAWNGPESAHFVAHADRYDRQLEPFTQALLERAGRGTNQVVLDVGCGSGATTLAAAASAERVVGVDLSQPLVELARRRARVARITNAEFVIADAQTHDGPDARIRSSTQGGADADVVVRGSIHACRACAETLFPNAREYAGRAGHQRTT